MIVLLLLVAAPWAGAEAEQRVALVIGNGAYRNVGKLANPANDARSIAGALQASGFSLVGGGAQLDLDRAHMEQAIRDFGRRLGHDTIGLFYYAGHGIQFNGSNYLIPVSANITGEADVKYELVDAAFVLDEMTQAHNRLNLVILDACRNNPFAGRGLRAVRGGLAQVTAPAGTVIAYATQPGAVAADGDDGHSPYTAALVRAIARPKLDVFATFNTVGLEVEQTTNGRQQPWVATSPIAGEFYFSELAEAVASAAPAPGAEGAAEAPVAELSAPPPAAPTVVAAASTVGSEGAAKSIVTKPEAAASPRPSGVTKTHAAGAAVKRPPPPPRDDIAGKWQGYFHCQSDAIGFSLEISQGDGNRISAVFESFPLPGTASFPHASFAMSGDYDRADGAIRLQAGPWIKRPLGVQSHDLEGQLARQGSAIDGRILTTGCAQFVLLRK